MARQANEMRRLVIAALQAGSRMRLVAAPAYAAMALYAAAGHETSPLAIVEHALPAGAMVFAYVLMSAINLAPWLKLVSGRTGVPIARPAGLDAMP